MFVDEMRIFSVIAECKSFSQAAEILHLSRPGLTQKIKQLEHRYQSTFFERSSKGVVPTEAGVIMIRFAEQILDLEEKTKAELAALHETFVPTIKVGASFADGVALLPRIVTLYHNEHPEQKVHLQVDYEPGLLAQVEDGTLDFAIVENVTVPNKGIELTVLGQKRLVCLAPNRHPFNQLPQPVRIEKFLALPMIIYEWNSGRHLVGDTHFREHHGLGLNEYDVVARFDTHEAMIEGVKAGLGWGMFPEVIANRYWGQPEILRLKLDTPTVLYPVSVALKSDRILSADAEHFLDFCLRNMPADYFHTRK